MRVEAVDWTSEMVNWRREECRRVGRSIATILRMVQTGGDMIDAWRLQYPQLSNLFYVDGFEDFMGVIASNLLRDSAYVAGEQSE